MLRFDPTELRNTAALRSWRTVVEGFLTGVHRSPYKVSPSNLRSIGNIAPAMRFDTSTVPTARPIAITSLHEEETNLKAYLLVDASASMGYKGNPKNPTKFQDASTSLHRWPTWSGIKWMQLGLLATTQKFAA